MATYHTPNHTGSKPGIPQKLTPSLLFGWELPSIRVAAEACDENLAPTEIEVLDRYDGIDRIDYVIGGYTFRFYIGAWRVADLHATSCYLATRLGGTTWPAEELAQLLRLRKHEDFPTLVKMLARAGLAAAAPQLMWRTVDLLYTDA